MKIVLAEIDKASKAIGIRLKPPCVNAGRPV